MSNVQRPRTSRRGDNKTCPDCGRTFTKPAHLLRHISTHVGGRPFPCGSCQRAFSRADALARHERTVHKDEDGVTGSTSAGGNNRQGRGSKRQSDEASLGFPPSDQSNDNLTQEGSTQLTTTQNIIDDDDEVGFNDNQHNQTSDETRSVSYLPSTTSSDPTTTPTAAPRHPNLSNPAIPTAHNSISPLESGNYPSLSLSSSSSLNTGRGIDSHEWTWILPTQDQQPEPFHAVSSGGGSGDDGQGSIDRPRHDPIVGLTGSDIHAATTSIPNIDQAPTSPFSALVGLIYEVDNLYDGHFNTFPGSWLHFDEGYGNVPIGIDPLPDLGLPSIESIQPPNAFRSEDMDMNIQMGSIAPPIGTGQSMSTMSRSNMPPPPPFGTVSTGSRGVGQGIEEMYVQGAGQGGESYCSVNSEISSINRGLDMDHRRINTQAGTSATAETTTTGGGTSLPPPIPGPVDKSSLHRRESGDIHRTKAKSITMPKEISRELDFDAANLPSRDDVIPTMKYLEDCLHLYFEDFHPSLPVLHRPTFNIESTSPLLLLSACSIGCMYVGSSVSGERGRWIFERLHHIVLLTWESRIKSDRGQGVILLVALLGQTFALLSGKQNHRLIAETSHSSLIMLAERVIESKLLQEDNDLAYDAVADLDHQSLQLKWTDWAFRETLRRACLALIIHGAELSVSSLTLIPLPVSFTLRKPFCEALFEATNAETWRLILLRTAQGEDMDASTSHYRSMTHDVASCGIQATATLSHTLVSIHTMHNLKRNMPYIWGGGDDNALSFYTHMSLLSQSWGILPCHTSQRTPTNKSPLLVLWHYGCLLFLVEMDEIGKLATAARCANTPATESLNAWFGSSQARLATLHCAFILMYSAQIMDLTLLVPRAIFHSALVLLFFLESRREYSGPSAPPFIVDSNLDVDWPVLAQFCSNMQGVGGRSDLAGASQLHKPTTAMDYVSSPTFGLGVENFTEGRDCRLDSTRLLSRVNRSLRRSTPWGIGEVLADILSSAASRGEQM